MKKRDVIYKTIIVTSGFFIFLLFFLNSYVRFDSYKKYSLFGKIEEIKKARVGKVFRFGFSTEFYNLYLDSEEELKVGDSVSKYPYAKNIDVYRNKNNKTVFFKSFEITDGLLGN